MGVPPTLLDLCVATAIDNIQYLGDVGETDINLLKIILAHCSPEQLSFIEDSTEGRDLSAATDEVWCTLYLNKFGEESYSLVKKRMKEKRVSFKWRLLYEAKLKELEKREKECLERSLSRLRELYAKADSERANKKIKITNALPPDSKRKSFYGGAGSSFANVKSQLMKKAKIEFVASREALKKATMYNKAVQQRQTQLSHDASSKGLSTSTCIRGNVSSSLSISRGVSLSSKAMPSTSASSKVHGAHHVRSDGPPGKANGDLTFSRKQSESYPSATSKNDYYALEGCYSGSSSASLKNFSAMPMGFRNRKILGNTKECRLPKSSTARYAVGSEKNSFAGGRLKAGSSRNATGVVGSNQRSRCLK